MTFLSWQQQVQVQAKARVLLSERAALEERIRAKTRLIDLDLLDFIPAVTPMLHGDVVEPPQHFAEFASVFDRIDRGEAVRVLFSGPPQMGKSTIIEHGIARALARRPHLPIVYASYGDDVATAKSREMRDIARRIGLEFRDDADRVDDWLTPQGGGLRARSIGGPLTGQPAKILIVDDIHKGRKDAESALARQNVFDWFTSVADTRVHPDSSIIICSCMVGDTPVLMADGTEKTLRELSVGDSIASYENGSLSSSRVLNWANQGPDTVFAITTESGTVVRANARHPFLVERGGKKEWTRLRDLRVGDAIVRATPRGGSGGESHAPPKDAVPRPSARDFAIPITAKPGAQPATDPHRPAQALAEHFDSGIATASRQPTTTPSSEDRAASAPCADSHLARTSEHTGAASSASTTITQPVESEASSATTATLPSATGRPPRSSCAPLDTFSIAPDRIVSIVECGVEDVFDIEVERTENFVANGLVSHNTRWHDDDLIGRLADRKKPDGTPRWEYLLYSAIKDDGSPLWHRRPLEFLRQKQENEYDWWSLWMGKPRTRGDRVFKGVSYYDKLPARYRIGKGVDLAYTEAKRACWSVGIVLVESDGDVYVVDVRRKQCEVTEFRHDLEQADASWPGAWHWFIGSSEKGTAQLLPELGIAMEGVRASSDKLDRAQAVAAAWNARRVFVPRNAPWLKEFVDEVGGFTGIKGETNDQVDALASAFEGVRYRADPPRTVKGAGTAYEHPDGGRSFW